MVEGSTIPIIPAIEFNATCNKKKQGVNDGGNI